MIKNKMWKKYGVIFVFVLAGALAMGCSSAVEAAVTVPESLAIESSVTAAGSEPGFTAISSEDNGSESVTNVVEAAASDIEQAVSVDAVDQIATAGLSDAEASGIIYMREEEKLARDVYLTLQEKWGLNIFGNIARSEDTHMEAVKTLIDRYDLVDPVEGRAIGEFSNRELQSLYYEMVEKGSQSLLAALEVGAAIEEIDIIDLVQYMAQTDERDIQQVYENLLRGSRNHLRSFVSVYAQNDGIYQPQYLSQEEYDEIISASIERGGSGRSRNTTGEKGNGRSGTGRAGNGARGRRS